MAETKREAICEAALALFAEKGVNATTTREIAQRADTAEGNLYRHFKNKEDLVHQLFELSAEQFHDTLAQAAGEISDPQERLAALVRGIFDFADEHRSAFNFLLSIHHTGILESRDRLLRPLPMHLFVETLQAGMSSRIFREVQPALTTGWIVAMAQRAVVFLASGLLPMSRDEVVARTIAAALRLVQREVPSDA